MTPADLRAWQAHMGLTQLAAAQALGVSLATYKRWLVGEVPRTTELACAALAAGLVDWPTLDMQIELDSPHRINTGCSR